MPPFIVSAFAGEVPLREPRLLENHQASKAVNCELERGSLRPLRGPRPIQALDVFPARTIFKHSSDGWLAWAKDVSVIKSAVHDVIDDAPLGHILITGDRDYPTQRLAGGETCRLGLPRPSSAPAVAVNEMAAAHTAFVRGYAVEGRDQLPQRYGGESASEIVPEHGALTVTLTAAEGEEPGVQRSTSYCYTLVRSMADGIIQQESAPSPPSAIVDVLHGDGTVVSGFDIPDDLEDLGVTHIRIYRTVAGAESADFRFVAEIPATQTSYADTAQDKDIDIEVLRTTLWDPIPDDARGLIKTDNGIYAAFRGNELLVSEPFVPYAFPDAYRLTVEDRITALAHVDNTIVILTDGRPYLAQGQSPESLQPVHLPIEQSCVSARSVSTLPGGVVFASPDGLMLFTAGEQSLITKDVMTRDQWRALGPESLTGEVHDGRYVGFFLDTGRGFIFDMQRRDIVRLELPDNAKVHALYRHTEDDCLYLSVETQDGSNDVCRFGDGGPIPFVWRSREVFTSALVGLSALRVIGEQRPRDAVFAAVYGPDAATPRARLRLTDGRTRRVAVTRSERTWSVELSGKTAVYELRFGTGVEGVESGQ
jgi:hypothetical protein